LKYSREKNQICYHLEFNKGNTGAAGCAGLRRRGITGLVIAYVPVLAYFGGCIAAVWWKSHRGRNAIRASLYLHRVSGTNCKLKVFLYNDTVTIYCGAAS
jgi:hypothetical protein